MAGFQRLGANFTQTYFNSILADIERHIRFCLGKGVVSGVALSAGSGLVVNIAAGVMVGYRAVAIAAATATAVSSSTKYLWIAEDGSTQWTDTATDIGTDWVCLGKVVAGASTITTITTDGRISSFASPAAGELQFGQKKLGFFGATPVAKTSVADPAAMTLGDNVVSGLSIGGSYNQAEVQALRDKVEMLRDDVAALRTTVLALIDALQALGLV